MPQTLKFGSKNLNTENWKVFHPNGKHMFTCGEKKAGWYLDRNLAKIVGEREIKFTFTPKGKGFQENDIFGLSGRKIQCVVSGISEDLQRHHIVPYCYRTHFPQEYKSKNHHDVVLVTYKVHEEYEIKATEFKDQLALEYNVKSLKDCNLDYTKCLAEYGNSNLKILYKFHSLFRSGGKLPLIRTKEVFETLSETTKIPYKTLIRFNYIQLYKLYLHLEKTYEKEFDQIKSDNRRKYDHGLMVVSKLDTHEKIEDFVKRWRNHFLDTMKPQYMPIGWSIDFKCKIEL